MNNAVMLKKKPPSTGDEGKEGGKEEEGKREYIHPTDRNRKVIPKRCVRGFVGCGFVCFVWLNKVWDDGAPCLPPHLLRVCCRLVCFGSSPTTNQPHLHPTTTDPPSHKQKQVHDPPGGGGHRRIPLSGGRGHPRRAADAAGTVLCVGGGGVGGMCVDHPSPKL